MLKEITLFIKYLWNYVETVYFNSLIKPSENEIRQHNAKHDM